MELFGIICSVLGAGTMAHLFMRLLEKAEGGVGRELGNDGRRDHVHVEDL